MSDQAIRESGKAITAEDVSAYLQDNPDFFLGRDDLLKDLTLPHDSGRAISLIERQVHLFREQRDTLRRELGELIDIARHNDRLFEKSKQLLTQVIEVKTLPEMASVLDDSIRNDFGLDAASLLVLDDRVQAPVVDGALLRVRADDARGELDGLLDGQRAVCGQFRDSQREFLFPDRETPIASVALVPLRNQSLIGLLAIGSHEPGYFDESMGSLFLTYISDTLSRLLPPLITRHDRAERIAAPVTGARV